MQLIISDGEEDNIVRVDAVSIFRVLKANSDKAVQTVSCSATELLDFILDVQRNAIENHIASSTD